MNYLPRFLTILLILLVFIGLQSILYAQQSIYDAQIPDKMEIKSSLQLIQETSVKSELTAQEMLQVYKAEVIISKSVGAWRSGSIIPDGLDSLWWRWGRVVDSTQSMACIAHIRKNYKLYRLVDDVWKGEENFLEPNRYWSEQLQNIFPDSPEAKEVAFDLDFKDFIRQYYIDVDAKGKSCEKYYKEFIKEYGDQFKDTGYTDEEMKQWAPECEKVRESFKNCKKLLLDKYHNAPFTKILFDIDVTTIVLHLSIC